MAGVGTTYYVGNHYEIYKTGGTTTFNKYYYFGANRVAARIGSTTPSNGTLFYMQGDHLGSSSLVMTSGGALNTRQTYFPYGAKRPFDGSALPTDYTFTGQKSDDSTGLMFYNARYYDTTLGRFTQPDSIIPNVLDPQSWNRYAYVLNNPVRYTDPTGHMMEDTDGGGNGYNDQPYEGPDYDYVIEPTDDGLDPSVEANGGGSSGFGSNEPKERPVAEAPTKSETPTPEEATCKNRTCTRGPWGRPSHFFPPATIMGGGQVTGDGWLVGGTVCVLCVMVDTRGHGAVLVLSTSGGPAAGIGASAGGIVEVTNKDLPHRLSDKFMDIGGSFYPGVGGGGDLVVGHNELRGISANAGVGLKANPVLPIVPEAHGFFNGPTLITIPFSLPKNPFSAGGGGPSGFE